jgi:RHS repeat-associated protein
MLGAELALCPDGARACLGCSPSISKTVAGETAEYALDLMATLPVVISDTEAVYLYGLDIIAHQQSQRYYYMHDGLGSVRQLVDSTGEIQPNYAYDPFGVPLVGGEAYNPYQYTGEAWDAEVELLYLRARYYQPEVGRFITRDPWAGDDQRPGTFNGYVYVSNNPVNLVDPRGLNTSDPLGSLLSDPPEVVRWIREEMVQNAQSHVLHMISTLNALSGRLPHPFSTGAKLDALATFGWQVRQGGPWDPKRYIERRIPPHYYHKVGRHWYYYDIWGNIMFGYLGTAGGFSEDELLNGAGLEQIGSDVGYTLRYGEVCRLPRPRHGWRNALRLWTWDHPQDRVTSRIGVRLWNLYGLSVQALHIVDAVVEGGDRGEIARHALPVFIYDREYRETYRDEQWYQELEEEFWRGMRPGP